MSSTRLDDLHLFAALKSRITSLATALYGTRASTPSAAFDLLSYTAANGTYGVALLLYTGPDNAPATRYEFLSYVEGQVSAVAGAEKLLRDMEEGMGGVVGKCAWGGRRELG